MKAVILCAGYATRLYPLTQQCAKPLLQIFGKPIVEHIVNQLVKLPSIFKIQIVTNDKFYADFVEWRDAYPYGKLIEILNDGSRNESDRLGAIGDLFYALSLDKEPEDTFVIAGDNFFDFNLGYFTFFSSLQVNPVIALYHVRNLKIASQYGVVSVDDEWKITRFEEKPKEPQSTLVSIGLYYLPMGSMRLISKYKEQKLPMDQIGHFIKWLCANIPVRGYPAMGTWYDIGDKETLAALQTIPAGFRRI